MKEVLDDLDKGQYKRIMVTDNNAPAAIEESKNADGSPSAPNRKKSEVTEAIIK